MDSIGTIRWIVVKSYINYVGNNLAKAINILIKYNWELKQEIEKFDKHKKKLEKDYATKDVAGYAKSL